MCFILMYELHVEKKMKGKINNHIIIIPSVVPFDGEFFFGAQACLLYFFLDPDRIYMRMARI